METVKLTALRDFAIEHSPRAQRVRNRQHATQDNYHVALYGTAALALSSPTASAIERAAAYLLQIVMGLSVNWDEGNKPTPRQRNDMGHQAIAAATDLCTLTHTSLPWLADAMSHEVPPPPVQAPDPAPEPTSRKGPPPPGIILSTKDAAEYLNMRPQTLHKWASNESGPLQPIRNGTSRLGWPSDEVIRVMQGK